MVALATLPKSDTTGTLDATILGLTLALSDTTGKLPTEIITITDAVLDTTGVLDAVILTLALSDTTGMVFAESTPPLISIVTKVGSALEKLSQVIVFDVPSMDIALELIPYVIV